MCIRDSPYLLFALLQRTDPSTQARRFFPLDLRPILARTQDFKLEDQDRLIVLGRNENGHEHRCGGWGWLLDGAGSAYDLGHQGLQLTLRMVKPASAGPTIGSSIDGYNVLSFDDPV